MDSLDIRQSQAFSQYLSSCGWRVHELTTRHRAYSRTIPLLGTVVRMPRIRVPLPWERIRELMRTLRPTLVKLEPDSTDHNRALVNDLFRHGFFWDPWPIEPTKTLRVDLRMTQAQLLANLSHGWRRDVRLANRYGVTITASNDIQRFIRIWQINARRKNYPCEPPSQLEKLWHAFHSRGNGVILEAQVNTYIPAALLLLFDRSTAHLWRLAYDGTHPETKPLYLLVWNAMLFAKQRGVHSFDFEGIFDERVPQSSRFYPRVFKHGFGGKPYIMTGSFYRTHPSILKYPYTFFSQHASGMLYQTGRLLTYDPFPESRQSTYQDSGNGSFTKQTRIRPPDYSQIYPEVLSQDGQRIAHQILSCLFHAGLANNTKQMKVLDLGCSSGFITNALASTFSHIYGIETDRSAIALAQKTYRRKNLSFSLFDGRVLPFPDASLDVVIFRRIVECVPRAEELTDEIYRVLKPGGFVYFESGNTWSPLGFDYHFPYCFPPGIKHMIITKLLRPKRYYRNIMWNTKEFRRLFQQFAIHDMTAKILRDPDRFRFINLIRWKWLFSLIPLPLLQRMCLFSPTIIWILGKE